MNKDEKSIKKKEHRSLSSMIVRGTVRGCIILGIAALIMGMGFNAYSCGKQYINLACNTAGQAAVNVTQEANVVPMATRVMEIYRSLSEEERQKVGTEEYRNYFKEISSDPEFEHVLKMLKGYLDHSDVYDVYLAMYDKETTAMVYIADPEEEDTLWPGEWEPVTEKGMMKFLNWNGEGQLYDIDRTAAYGWLCTAGIPLRDESGDIVAFVLTDISLMNLWHGIRGFALNFLVMMTLLILLVSRLMSGFVRKNMVEPLSGICIAAQNYVKDRREGKKDTDHFCSLETGSGNEVEELALTMAEMERDVSEYEENLTRITAEKEKMKTELSLASRLQEAFIPHEFPAFPDRTEFDLYGIMNPAREVGGDFYDYYFVDDDHLCLVMADVSGKGVPAALFMMVVKIILQSCAMLGKSPCEILTKTNEAICPSNQQDMFVTVWVGILEISTGILTAANAGHEYPVIRHPGGDYEVLRDKHGFIIGGMEDSVYTEYQLTLEPGSSIFVYTDGVPEASDAEDNMFGMERMVDALNSDRDASPRETLENVTAAVDRFVNDAEQFDDLTMLCITYKGKNC